MPTAQDRLCARDPTVIATCCPYCLTMFEDGIKDEKAEGRVRVLDVAEILSEFIFVR